jgi:single-strand DNA-binding protein
VKKGQMVYVDGRMQTRSLEDKVCVKRYSTEVVGNSFTMLGRRSVDEGGNPPPTDDDDLPF